MRHAATGLLVLVGALAFLLSPAEAAILAIDLEVEFSGATPPAGATPWATATFDDSGAGVRLTMATTNLVGTEFVSEWLFNFDPTLDLSKLVFTAVDTSDSLPVVSAGVDDIQGRRRRLVRHPV